MLSAWPGPPSRVLQLVVILATEQHHQFEAGRAAISQEPLLYPWEAGNAGSEKKAQPGEGKTHLEPCSLTQDYQSLV